LRYLSFPLTKVHKAAEYLGVDDDDGDVDDGIDDGWIGSTIGLSLGFLGFTVD
jgi:hypothetical protein